MPSLESAWRACRRGGAALIVSGAGILLATSASAQIGMRQFLAGDMPMTVVYPTLVVAVHHTFGPFDLVVALDAMPERGNGRLVVVSHGSGGDAFTLHTLARTLALAGFVVAQPEHRGDNRNDLSDAGIVSWQRRPREITRAIDAIAADRAFAPILAFDRVGLYGISAGGGTGIAMAGGDWSVATLQRHCALHTDDDAGFCLYGLRTAAERAARARSYAATPAAADLQLLAGPLARDARIAAVVVSVPVGAIFTPASLATIRMPVGVVEAEADLILAPRFHSGYVLAACGTCRRLDSVAGGGHFDTLSPWPDSVAEAAATAPGAQRNPAIDDARRQQSYDRIAAFFTDQLLSDR